MAKLGKIDPRKVMKVETLAFAGQTEYSFPEDQQWKRVITVVACDSSLPRVLRHHTDMPNQKLYLEEVPDHSFTIQATVELI